MRGIRIGSCDLVERTTPDGTTRMRYDQAGRLLRAESPGAIVRLDRDACGRVVRETINGRSVTHEYDGAGRRISRSTPAGVRSQWAFDPAGRPQVLTTAGQQVRFAFDAAGREISRTFSAGGQLIQRFDAAHRLVNQVMEAVGDPMIGVGAAGDRVAPVTARSFRYRADGALAGISNQLTGESRRFDLDTTGRVVGVQAAGWTETYAYDNKSGNLAGASFGAAAVTGHDRPADVGSQEYSGTLIARAGGVTYRHDRQGRVVTRSRTRLSQKKEMWQYTCDADDRMVAATSAGRHWVYSYDVFGRRISRQRVDAYGRIAEQTLFTWDGNRLIEQTSVRSATHDVQVMTWDYLPASWEPISQTVGGCDADAEFFAIVSDLVGAPTELVTADGSRVAWSRADTTVWGAPRPPKAANKSSRYRVDCPIRFPGQYADDETGLHYNRHRYYDPAAARYTTSDPLGLAPADDPHSYVINPTGWSDPLGLGACRGAGSGIKSIDPSTIRYSQKSVRDASEIEQSMKVDGWVGEPIDVVRMPDGGLTTIDNTRVLAARRAGIDVQARIHDHVDPIPSRAAFRLKSVNGRLPQTWGDGVLNRIGQQNSRYRNTYPSGSSIIGWNGS